MKKIKIVEKHKQKCLEGNEPRILVTDEFIEKNKFKIDIEVAKKIMEEESLLGFEHAVAYSFLPFEDLKKYVAEGVQDFLDYMVFAWMKAMEEKGISASRSIIKLKTWLRILSRPDLADILDEECDNYGREELKKVCKELGIDYPDYL